MAMAHSSLVAPCFAEMLPEQSVGAKPQCDLLASTKATMQAGIAAYYGHDYALALALL
jgi:hypothetical protein